MSDQSKQPVSSTNDVLSISMEEVWQELVQFEKYFSDKDLIKNLVDWLHEDYSINKIASRLALKYIAPQVLKLAGTLGAAVGKSWLSKLQDRLLNNPHYEAICRTLLDTLKTKTDTTYQNAMQAGDCQALDDFKQQGNWSRLKSEQQGIAQLMLMGSRAEAQQAQLFDQVNTILDLLAFDLDLQSVAQLEDSTSEATEGSALWLTYRKRQVPLVGREAELQRLNNFYHGDENVSWWAITGAGGMGKSRLALESLSELGPEWHTGFLPQDKLDTDNALQSWQPQFPTVMVIDYVASHSEKIAQWLDHLLRHQDDYDFPVRLLLLEREYQAQDWWTQLTTGKSQALVRQQALHQLQPIELTGLSQGEQQTALASFLTQLNASNKRPESDNLWQTIDKLTHGSPLFLGMVAIALLNSRTTDIRNWDQMDLLDTIYQRELKLWRQQLTDEPKVEQDRIIALMAFATLVGGINWEDEDKVLTALVNAKLIKDEEDIEPFWQWVTQLTGSAEGTIQPDLIGEYFLLQHYPLETNAKGPKAKRIQRHLEQAFTLAPEGTAQTLIRCATDYYENSTPATWWQHLLNSQTEQQDDLYQLAFRIVNQLTLYGRYQAALDHWLPTLEQSENLEHQANALNQIGRIYQSTGQYPRALDYLERSKGIFQQIEHREGEGATLNNLSQIYQAQGDYNTSLKYLEQSLVICREIGERKGEGVTLNNFSTIYQAQGDYNTSLKYLEQSLVICQEIGDRKGEGSRLNNLSQIYKAQGDFSTALEYLEQSLVIKRDIGDRAGEGATLNNMATLAYSQGDYNTALGYFEQSLAIRRDIGDRAGLCTTLNNIGHIYWQAEQPEKAMLSWLEVYQITADIGFKRALDALENMGNQFGGNGLDFWKELLAKRSE